MRRHSMSAVAAQTTCPPMFLSSGVTFLLRASGGARVDVDSIRGCGFTSCLTQPLIHDPEHDLKRSRLLTVLPGTAKETQNPHSSFHVSVSGERVPCEH